MPQKRPPKNVCRKKVHLGLACRLGEDPSSLQFEIKIPCGAPLTHIWTPAVDEVRCRKCKRWAEAHPDLVAASERVQAARARERAARIDLERARLDQRAAYSDLSAGPEQ